MDDAPDFDEGLGWFRAFIAESRWRFARTYVESYPHEYTLERWVTADSFWRAILFIERWGAPETFWRERRKYFSVDGRKYWHMGDASSDTLEDRPTLINRTWLDVANYREEARKLGYDDARLDRLVERWQVLLEKARRGT